MPKKFSRSLCFVCVARIARDESESESFCCLHFIKVFNRNRRHQLRAICSIEWILCIPKIPDNWAVHIDKQERERKKWIKVGIFAVRSVFFPWFCHLKCSFSYLPIFKRFLSFRVCRSVLQFFLFFSVYLQVGLSVEQNRIGRWSFYPLETFFSVGGFVYPFSQMIAGDQSE